MRISSAGTRWLPRAALVAIAACGAHDAGTERLGESSSAVSGPDAQVDSTAAVANTTVWMVGHAGSGSSWCNGTLISPGFVLSANHCLVGEVGDFSWVGPTPTISVNDASAASVALIPRAAHSFYGNDAQVGVDDANDLAIYELDLPALYSDAVAAIASNGPSFADATKWATLAHAQIVHPTFTRPPNTEDASSSVTFLPASAQFPAIGTAAFYVTPGGAVEKRMVAYFSDLTDPSLGGGFWQRSNYIYETAPDGVEFYTDHGDSGAALFAVLANGSRQPFGVVHGGENCSDTSSRGAYTCQVDEWADLTDPGRSAFVEGIMKDSSRVGPQHAKWNERHPLPAGQTEWWIGDVEYYGPCVAASADPNQNDADCDHWYDVHDNCPGVFNPDQADVHDLGYPGDACPKCPCDPEPTPDPDNDGICNIACPPTLVDQTLGLTALPADNCPTVPNVDQGDANFEAERQVSLSTGCGGYTPCDSSIPSSGSGNGGSGDGHQPTLGDSYYQTASLGHPMPSYLAHFQAAFPGDACDPTPSTTTTLQAGALSVSMPCTLCYITDTQGDTHCYVDPYSSCQSTSTSQVTMSSWIGNAAGNSALSGSAGTSGPSFCPCSLASAGGTDPALLEACGNTQFRCPLATDGAFAGATASPSVQSSWGPITRYDDTTQLDTPFVPQATTHLQVRSDVPYSPPYFPTGIFWDSVYDDARYGQLGGTALVGVLWTQIVTFAGHARPSSQLTPNLANGYVGTVAAPSIGTMIFTPAPPPTTTATSTPSWYSGAWMSTLVQGDHVVSPWLGILREAGAALPLNQTRAGAFPATSVFDAASLGLLAAVPAGQADLLIGDDVAAGVPRGAHLLTAVFVEPGTTTVLGGLRSGDGVVAGVSPSRKPSATADPPQLRSFDSADGRLRALQVASGGATLSEVDVLGALTDSPFTASVAVTGAVPMAPVAMVWNASAKRLYVADVTTDHWRGSVLRLLALDTAGVAVELWRTAPTWVVPTVYLSASATGATVIAISFAGESEIVTLDATGKPLSSRSVQGQLVSAPTVTAVSVTFPLKRARWSEKRLNLLLRSVLLTNVSPGLCGSTWLRASALGSPSDVLRAAAIGCHPCGDGADWSDDDDSPHDRH